MDLLAQSFLLKDLEYRALAKLIYDKSGINLGDFKQELLKARLGKRLRALGLKSYGAYFKYAVDPGNNEELTLLINAISTNYTSFWRGPRHYDFLQKTALGDITKRKEALRSKKVRGWCAAASSGEEPYSLGITLLEYFIDKPGWDIKLLATDISRRVLTEAIQGVYSHENVKTTNPLLLDRYFDKESQPRGDMYRVKDEVKKLIVFRQLNLMDAVFPFNGQFDFIFCKNVMIYFDTPTRVAVVDKLLKYLAVGGYLFIGHSENLPPEFRTRVEPLAPATYRKI